jgi:hypothetical protein
VRRAFLMQHGWFESMSVNSIVPNPVTQSTADGTVRMSGSLEDVRFAVLETSGKISFLTR